MRLEEVHPAGEKIEKYSGLFGLGLGIVVLLLIVNGYGEDEERI